MTCGLLWAPHRSYLANLLTHLNVSIRQFLFLLALSFTTLSSHLVSLLKRHLDIWSYVWKISGLKSCLWFPQWSVSDDFCSLCPQMQAQNLSILGHCPYRVRPGIPMTSSFLLPLLSSFKRVPSLSSNSTSITYQLSLHCQLFCSFCAILGLHLSLEFVKQVYSYLNFHWSLDLLEVPNPKHTVFVHAITTKFEI